MAEDFDYLLSVHHFLDKSIHISEILLLFLEIFSRQSRKHRRYLQHDKGHDQSHDRKRDIQHDHRNQRRCQRCRGVDDLWDALAEQLSQCIHIIGIHGHNVAVGVGVKILDRQGLHVCEQLITELPHSTLADVYHDPVVCIRSGNTDNVKHNDPGNRMRQRRKIRILRI